MEEVNEDERKQTKSEEMEGGKEGEMRNNRKTRPSNV